MTYSFFGLGIDPTTLIGKALVLILATVLGGIIGLERQWHGNPAGLRTHILVCLGSTLITLTSVEIGIGRAGDPAHLAAQIVSGIGFLGAGAILRDGTNIHGITTAASIWVTAAIGIALGANPHLGELGVIATVIVMITLVVLARLESALKLRSDIRCLIVGVHEEDDGPARLLDLLKKANIGIQSLEQSTDTVSSVRRMQMEINLPGNFDRSRLNSLLTQEKGVASFQWK